MRDTEPLVLGYTEDFKVHPDVEIVNILKGVCLGIGGMQVAYCATI